MQILFVGDVFGSPGRRIVGEHRQFQPPQAKPAFGVGNDLAEQPGADAAAGPVVVHAHPHAAGVAAPPLEAAVKLLRRDILSQPDMVQRFVDASAIGWYHYLYGDNSKANELIKTENPDITDEQIAFSIAEMKKHGVVDSGDTLTLGIGAMTDARWKDFFDKMVETGMVDAKTDYRKAYTLQFVDKGVGLDLRPK